MTVKRVKPKELPQDIILRLNYLYHAELGEFIAMTDRKENTLFVNEKVPQKDIDGFLEVIMFPDYWVNDEESGKGQFLDYVYEKYGNHTCMALVDAHSWRMEQKNKQQAKEAAKAIIPMIEKEVSSEEPIVEYDEYLMHEIYCAGLHRNGKTPKNISGFSNVYVFYLGYLMGAGKLDSGTDMKMKYITDTERMMRQIKDEEELKKIYTVAKTLLDIQQEKGGAK